VQNLLDEVDRMMQMHGATKILSKGTNMVITPVTLGGIGELATNGNTSVEGYNEQQTS